jgi:hypothetical protein
MHRRTFIARLAALGMAPAARTRAGAAASGWQAGVASVDITPDTSLWMAGFAARTQPSQGTALPLHAKALALRAGSGAPAVLITVDLLGVTAAISDKVAAALRRRHGLDRAHLLINASHTHCGPVVDEQLSVAYDLSAAQWEQIQRYTEWLEARLAGVAHDALSRLRAGRLSYGIGEAAFAANRREQFTPDGPVDHAVPVLRVDTASGDALAIVFGYACHNTTLQAPFVQYHADYAGVAQAALEQRHRGAVALFVQGCGADANPKPRGTLELVEAHGTALADAVDRALASVAPVAPSLRTRYGVVDLPFVDDAQRGKWLAQLTIEDVYMQRYARLMESRIRAKGKLPDAQPDPIQTWRLGSDLIIVALGGEVVVDYALRLRHDYPDARIWAAGYSNDVFGYVPSRRVLAEGGYEGGDAMVYYGRPAPFTPAVEELIHAEVRRQLRP